MKTKISITAYIICNNRQIVEREVNTSKRFVFNNETYIIKRKCIYLKLMEDGTYKPVMYYRETNPNPYYFAVADKDIVIKEKFKNKTTDIEETKNIFIAKKDELIPNYGISEQELNYIYGEDLYDMLVKIQSETPMIYMLVIMVVQLALGVISLIGLIFGLVV